MYGEPSPSRSASQIIAAFTQTKLNMELNEDKKRMAKVEGILKSRRDKMDKICGKV